MSTLKYGGMDKWYTDYEPDKFIVMGLFVLINKRRIPVGQRSA